MKVKCGGPFTTLMPNGVLESPVPGSEITIDDTDAALVAHWTMLAQAGHAEILEPAETKKSVVDPDAADPAETKKAVTDPDAGQEKPAAKPRKAAPRTGGDQ